MNWHHKLKCILFCFWEGIHQVYDGIRNVLVQARGHDMPYRRHGYVRYCSIVNADLNDQSCHSDNDEDKDNGDLGDFVAYNSADKIYRQFSCNDERPSKIKWLWECICTAFCIMILATLLIASVCCVLTFFLLNFASVCTIFDNQWEDMPIIVQKFRITCDTFRYLLILMWFPINLSVMFSFKVVWKHHVVLLHLFTASMVAIIRLLLYVYHSYGYTWQEYTVRIVFLITVLISARIIVSKLHEDRNAKIKQFFALTMQFILGLLFVVTFIDGIIPLFTKSKHKILIAVLTPFPGYVFLVICRALSVRVKVFIHPGKLHLMSSTIHTGTVFAYRFLQASIPTLKDFIITSVLLSLFSFLERISILFFDYFITWLCRKITNNMSHNSKISPKLKRATADSVLAGFSNEVLAIVV